ncbi:hypothetical protein DFQ05_0564 [Winogradskyella wandonensis]|uniref:Uncharacterized protein n=1 Tax=Winogradskyella wandonensis TaxID=1442586 RepID=A0A4R1KWK2_9FLAO|nr:hypothetical protein [Winogradskyella wandonensis]TCK69053.1 hypothetical protein DFQ05_0564 [Winogradskyella wandonensis]
MTLSKLINTICIILGAAVAIYAKAEENQNPYVLIGGIVLLMFGLYRVARTIPSKYDNTQEESFIKSEKDTSTSLSEQITNHEKVD